MDTVYKSFGYHLTRFNASNHSNLDNEYEDELKLNVSLHLKDDQNEDYLKELIPNWLECKTNHDLLSDEDHLVVLAHFCRLHLIVYRLCDEDGSGCALEMSLDHNDVDDGDGDGDVEMIRLLYTPKRKQYRLLCPTMTSIIKRIDSDYNKWNLDQVLEWLNSIEFGLFKDDKYEFLKTEMSKLQIDGQSVTKMNDLTLKSMGMNDELSQKVLLENIEKLQCAVSIETNHNDHGHNDGIIEEEELLKSNRTPGGGTDNGDFFEIPQEFLDPIHYTIMRDPVLSIVSGHTFERQSITDWINENHSDPMNQMELKLNQLVPNRTLREGMCYVDCMCLCCDCCIHSD